ncbi:hypothetical protein, partial [Ruminococcus sp.]|uniref:hypothetical protein n=1 Tax=Ruminococcus sp. TaxID=41978 RepID=UPI002B8190E1
FYYHLCHIWLSFILAYIDSLAVAYKHYFYHTFFLSDLRCIAVFCAVYRGIFFLLPIWQNGAKTTKRGKILQTADIVSSKIVVEIEVFYY